MNIKRMHYAVLELPRFFIKEHTSLSFWNGNATTSRQFCFELYKKCDLKNIFVLNEQDMYVNTSSRLLFIPPSHYLYMCGEGYQLLFHTQRQLNRLSRPYLIKQLDLRIQLELIKIIKNNPEIPWGIHTNG